MISSQNHSRIYLLAGFIFMQLLIFAQKNDTVYLHNGDRITGEVKKFEYGILTLKTDAMSTLSIEFDRIFAVYSAKFFEIRSSTGDLYYGSLGRSRVPGIINIVGLEDTIPKPILDIVQITSIKNQFWKRIDGSVDLGLSFTKASNVMQFNLNSKVSYRTTKYLSEIALNSIITDQQSKDVSRNNDLAFILNRVIEGNWFVGAQTKGQQNTELNLDYRYQAGLGAGYDIVHTNSNRLFSIAGFLGNVEKTLDTQEESVNYEALLSLNYKWFRYRSPKIDLTSRVNAYPSITVRNRVRFDFNLQGKFEIIKDLYFSITIYDEYDSKPSADQSGKNDWGLITSFGYTF